MGAVREGDRVNVSPVPVVPAAVEVVVLGGGLVVDGAVTAGAVAAVEVVVLGEVRGAVQTVVVGQPAAQKKKCIFEC